MYDIIRQIVSNLIEIWSIDGQEVMIPMQTRIFKEKSRNTFCIEDPRRLTDYLADRFHPNYKKHVPASQRCNDPDENAYFYNCQILNENVRSDLPKTNNNRSGSIRFTPCEIGMTPYSDTKYCFLDYNDYGEHTVDRWIHLVF